MIIGLSQPPVDPKPSSTPNPMPPPDLILLDIMMPEMDGYEVCRRLRSDASTRDIPVIFVTARAEAADEVKGFELGAVDYIAKPINPYRVKARIRTHLLLRQAKHTLKLQNAELKEAARLREDVDHIMRHDLKGPLNSIIGSSQILLHSETRSEADRRRIESVEAAGYRMLNMVNLSLDLLKMERKEEPIRCKRSLWISQESCDESRARYILFARPSGYPLGFLPGKALLRAAPGMPCSQKNCSVTHCSPIW